MAENSNKKSETGAHLVFLDESGFLMAPLLRRTQAPRGKTPILKQKASHRDHVSAISALSYSPIRNLPCLYFQTLPEGHFNNERVAAFVRQLLRHLRGSVILVWDRGNMHKGPSIRQLQADFPRLSLELLPPYAPHLNPVEALWNYLKYDELANYAPTGVDELDQTLIAQFQDVRRNRRRLQTFYSIAELPELNTTIAT
jgi:transposase